jgi:hypothetical protein
MDLTTLGIFIGLILTGMVAGIPIGQAFEHRRLLRRPQVFRRNQVVMLRKDQVPDFLKNGRVK